MHRHLAAALIAAAAMLLSAMPAAAWTIGGISVRSDDSDLPERTLCAPALTSSSLVVNGSFETPDLAPGTWSILPNPLLAPWYHAPRSGTTSSGIELHDNVAGAPATGAGNQYVELDSDGPSRVRQDVATTIPGLYRLSFLWSPRPGTAADQNHFRVTVGSLTTTFGPLAGGSETSWRRECIAFTRLSGSTRVEFTDLGPEEPGGGGVGAYLDDVSVAL